jgi:hypothetical protein
MLLADVAGSGDWSWVYASLTSYKVEPSLRTGLRRFALPVTTLTGEEEWAPKPLRAYLKIGAKIWSEPAIGSGVAGEAELVEAL